MDNLNHNSAYGITVHKCQGLSLNSALIDLTASKSARTTCGLGYVALSRVRTLNGLHLIGFNANVINVNAASLLEYNRLRTFCINADLPQYEIDRPRRRPDVPRMVTGDLPIVKPARG